MFSNIISVVLLVLAVTVNSATILPRTGGVGPVTLPQFSAQKPARAANLSIKRDGWQYGPPILGGPPSPAGTLGLARTQTDIGIYEVDAAYVSNALSMDLPAVEVAIGANGGLRSVSDYSTVLYNGQWKDAIPSGEEAGILTNYTQDLQFSMERLSLNPYPLRRIKPLDSLPFTLDDRTAIKISTLSLAALQRQGRLFVVDHSYQTKYPKNAYFGAACTAYFYIHPTSGDFLPLAIKTNVGANLTYTPLDSPNDWLLAKLMFNVNDFFHAEAFHLAASHCIGEIVHQAAERTLSEDHPVMALLDHLMVGAYATRPVGAQVLFNPGGSFDEIFYINATGALEYMNDVYPTAGAYQSNYLDTDFTNRGLIGCNWGPKLKSFPFYEDAKALMDNIHTFMTDFVNSYYADPLTMYEDYELQQFFHEAKTVGIPDFTCSDTIQFFPCVDTHKLIQTLTHFGYLNVLHQALNTGSLVTALGTLPFHPAALYAPLPTTKNVTDLLPFLPPIPKALFQINLTGDFNRPQYPSQNRTLVYAFADPTFLARFNPKVNAAAATFKTQMLALSKQIQSRGFDANGLSQGMPFVYKCLDPGTIPYFFAI